MRTVTRTLLVVATLALAGCDALPRDPDGTLDRARDGVLRVGVSEAPPWVVEGSGDSDRANAAGPGGVEPEALRSFARSLGAEIQWHAAGAEENLLLLERGELDVVAAGLTKRSPWNGRVALTRPYARTGGERRVLATAPGENALLVALERHLREHPPRQPSGGERDGIR